MLYETFITQWKYPVKGDWTLEVKANLTELNICLELEDIKNKSKSSFKNLVKVKTQEYTLNYLLNKKERHSKMENLNYFKLKLQNYLRDKNISVDEARNLFRYRTRVAKFKQNMKSSFSVATCPFCLVQPDTKAHTFQCPDLKLKVKLEGNYCDIFSENIPKDISITLLKISKIREDIF